MKRLWLLYNRYISNTLTLPETNSHFASENWKKWWLEDDPFASFWGQLASFRVQICC